MTMISFPSIEQFRNVIYNVRQKTFYDDKDSDGNIIVNEIKELPILTFEGTVKLHGSNAAIQYNVDNEHLTYQSRNSILSLQSDLNCFMLYMETIREKVLTNIFRSIVCRFPISKIVVYGEWAGQGIQKGVAIAELAKMFVIFGIRVVDNEENMRWLDFSDFEFDLDEYRVFSIYNFPTYEVKIDFNYPQLIQNTLIDLTDMVERECPVGKYFGVSGIGEGIVFKCVTPGYNSSKYWFKSKGDAHSNSKVKTLNPIDVESVENVRKFVEYAVTENRLDWALNNMLVEQLVPFEMKSLGTFIKTVSNDVFKEERDVIVKNQIDAKKIGSAIANVARPWYIKKIDEG
jgi:hypothetical protein